MRIRRSLHINKKAVLAVLLFLIIAGAGTLFYVTKKSKSPLPSDIKEHVSFKIIYPSTHSAHIDKNSFVYQAKQKVLTFNVEFAGTKIAYSEQAVPDNLGSDTQAYYPALGIHPYAQFKSNIGQVALTKFWQSGSLKPEGQSAVIASNDTFLIAHSNKSLSNTQWKDLFQNLKINK
jgi:hypothetical protein